MPRLPWETHAHVEKVMWQWDRTCIYSSTARFLFSTRQSRLMLFVDLWDRGQRARVLQWI